MADRASSASAEGFEQILFALGETSLALSLLFLHL